MRTAIASLIALGFATAALAQEAAPAPAPAPEAAPVAPATPAPDAAASAAPAPAAAAPAPEPEKTYELPTTGDAGQIISAINNVCKPLVKGGDLDELAKNLGYKKNKRDRTWSATMGQKPYSLTIWPQGSNKDVCRMTVQYAVDQEKPIIVGLNIFSYLHRPELLQQRNDFVPATDYKRITNSWEYFDDSQSIGLVFLQLKKPDGSSAGKGYDMGEILYSERKLK
jgi:hypothetical protein